MRRRRRRRSQGREAGVYVGGGRSRGGRESDGITSHAASGQLVINLMSDAGIQDQEEQAAIKAVQLVLLEMQQFMDIRLLTSRGERLRCRSSRLWLSCSLLTLSLSPSPSSHRVPASAVIVFASLISLCANDARDANYYLPREPRRLLELRPRRSCGPP